MHDIKAIRTDPAAFDAAMARRGLPPQSAHLLEMDTRRRADQTELQTLQEERNRVAKAIGQAKGRGEDAADLLAQAQHIRERMDALTATLDEASGADALSQALSALPNLPAADVPDGADEHANVEVARWGTPRTLEFPPQDHVALGEAMGGMDFAAAAKLSGARFVVLRGALARLERALGQFMLDLHTRQHGFTEISPPLLVKDDALYGSGQLPKFAADLFRTTGDHWLIPTAEVALANLAMDSILDAADLPLRVTALTQCFRSEAGSAGRDTRGMIRQHQFAKVELITFCTPEAADAEQQHMLRCAETVLQQLELPYRTMLLCAGDMGFAATRTYDLEVWLPGQQTYREISSVSTCGDFQARRMKARFRAAGDKNTRFLHILNGSGLAVGRTLVAVLENGQQADGSVTLPAALAPYLHGARRLTAKGELT